MNSVVKIVIYEQSSNIENRKETKSVISDDKLILDTGAAERTTVLVNNISLFLLALIWNKDASHANHTISYIVTKPSGNLTPNCLQWGIVEVIYQNNTGLLLHLIYIVQSVVPTSNMIEDPLWTQLLKQFVKVTLKDKDTLLTF